MPRPRSLNQVDLAKAALAVIDRDGLTALTIRAVASELGMSAMGLYRYVEDRDQLEGLVFDLVLRSVDPTLSPRASWRRRVTILLERVRDAIGAHPSVVPLLLARRFTSDAVGPWSEALLDTLADAGFTGRQRFIAFRTLLSYIVGAIQTEHLGLVPQATQALPGEGHPDEFPLLAEHAQLIRNVPLDTVFRHGLNVVLEGLDAQISRS